MKRRLALLLAAVLLLGGCASLPEADELEEEWEDYQQFPRQEADEEEKPAEPVYPAAFSLPYHRDHTLDPVTCGEGIQETAASLLYEPLFVLDGSFQPEAVLCESFSWDSTGLVCTLTLREGVTFSDGSLLTARDAAETLQRAKESERYAYRLRNMVSAAANRAGQVVITLSAPNRGLPALLDIPVVKRTTAGQPVPVGTGPYRLVNDGGGAYLQAREDWWQQKSLPAETIPLVDAKDRDTALYLFSARRVELLPVDPTEDPSLVTGKAQSTSQPTSVLQFIGFNTAEGRLFSSAALRAAFSRGIDRETLVHAQLVQLALAAQFLELDVERRCQPAGVGVPGGKEDRVVGVRAEALPQLGGDVVQALLEQVQAEEQHQREGGQRGADQPGEHGVHLISGLFCGTGPRPPRWIGQ